MFVLQKWNLSLNSWRALRKALLCWWHRMTNLHQSKCLFLLHRCFISAVKSTVIREMPKPNFGMPKQKLRNVLYLMLYLTGTFSPNVVWITPNSWSHFVCYSCIFFAFHVSFQFVFSSFTKLPPSPIPNKNGLKWCEKPAKCGHDTVRVHLVSAGCAVYEPVKCNISWDQPLEETYRLKTEQDPVLSLEIHRKESLEDEEMKLQRWTEKTCWRGFMIHVSVTADDMIYSC